MVKPNKLLKFFQFIKFPLYQTSGQNYSMIPNIENDLLAIGQELSIQLIGPIGSELVYAIWF
jgi:hypothetical protein